MIAAIVAGTAVGALAALVVWPLVSYASLLYLRPSNISRYRHGDESWALVTGASDGIGYGFVAQLAQRGFNVILHGRNRDKIERHISTLRQQFPERSFRSFICDAFTRSSFREEVSSWRDQLRAEGVNLTVLVNNVGSGGPDLCFEPLANRTPEDIEQRIDINLTFPTLLTSALLPVLVKSQPALVIDLGSLAGVFSTPYQIPYGNEMHLKGHDIDVLGVIAGPVQSYTTTRLGIVSKPGLVTPSAVDFAEATLQRVGCRRNVIAPYWPHAFLAGFLNLMPQWVGDNVMRNIVVENRQKEQDLREKNR